MRLILRDVVWTLVALGFWGFTFLSIYNARSNPWEVLIAVVMFALALFTTVQIGQGGNDAN
jgi:hypothetical protein